MREQYTPDFEQNETPKDTTRAALDALRQEQNPGVRRALEVIESAEKAIWAGETRALNVPKEVLCGLMNDLKTQVQEAGESFWETEIEAKHTADDGRWIAFTIRKNKAENQVMLFVSGSYLGGTKKEKKQGRLYWGEQPKNEPYKPRPWWGDQSEKIKTQGMMPWWGSQPE